MFAQIVAAQSSSSKTSKTFSSSGVVSSPPLLSPTSSNLLPLTGICADYTLLYEYDGSPENWYLWGSFWLDKMVEMKSKGYSTPMLAFHFNPTQTGSSLYTEARFDRVLEIFASVGLTPVIASNFNIGTQQGDSESQLVWNSWIQFTNHHKGNTRIAAVNIYNEPSRDTMANPHTTYADCSRQTKFLVDLTKAIHAIDPDRIVIFPMGAMYYGSDTAGINAWLNDLQSTGIINEPNVVFDGQHPYFWDASGPYGWDSGKTPEDRAAWYINTFFIPLANLVGYNRVWCGGTAGPRVDYSTDDAIQRRWVIAIINAFVAKGIGFTITPCFGSIDGWALNEEALLASNYGR